MSNPRKFLISVCALAALLAIATWQLWPQIDRRLLTYGLKVRTFASGLDTPWSIAFLPDGQMLVTERPGRLRRIDFNGKVGPPIAGVPAVRQGGEAGLFDVVLAPDFASTHRLFLSYSEPAADGAAGASTAVARAVLDGDALKEVTVIFRQPHKLDSDVHYGSRLLFTPEGRLLVGLGDRGQRNEAQDLSSAHGKLLRVTQDGEAAPGNPFIGRDGALGQIWSYGHRNIQGLVFHPTTGSLWASEHGPQGGDEINLIRAGANYGWPVITYGCEYDTCAKIGEGTAKAGMEQPLTWFAPKSVPLTGMAFVTSDRYPQWKGQLFVGVLHGPAMIRIAVDGDKVVSKTPMWLNRYGRVRDIKQGPDGWLYLAAQLPEGAILRLER